MSRRRHTEALGTRAAGEGAEARGHETRDVPARLVLGGFAVLLGASALLLVVTSLVQYAYVGRLPCLCPPDGVFSVNATAVPEAVIRRQNPQSEVQPYLATQNERLHTYGWVDQKTGVVHIPIERAMELLLQRGLPTRPQADTDRFEDKGDALPSYSSSGRMTESRIR